MSTGGDADTEDGDESTEAQVTADGDVASGLLVDTGTDGLPAAGELPGARREEATSIINAILMALGILLAVFVLVNSKRRRYLRWAALAVAGLGVLCVVLFFATESLSPRWILFNSYTALFAIHLRGGSSRHSDRPAQVIPLAIKIKSPHSPTPRPLFASVYIS